MSVHVTLHGGSTVQPLLLAGLVALAAGGAMHAIGQTLPETTGWTRYLANPFCVAIFAVGIWALVYGLLELSGLGLDAGREAGRTRRWASARDGAALFVPSLAARDPQDEAALRAEIWEGIRLRRAAPLGYAIWVLPLLGFIGTVIGISAAIGGLGDVFAEEDRDSALQKVLDALRFAFDTTFAGLVLVIPVMAVSTLVRLRSETIRGRLVSEALDSGLERV